MMGTDRQRFASGAPWEPLFGYSRAVRVGNTIYVAGTTAPGTDAYEQAKGALRKIETALREAGATLEHVVQTRIFLVNIRDSDSIARAHRETFENIRPASTLLQVGALVRPEFLVEIEAVAVV
jgi:enamine deaminase RidA (YjgF/YER057c/UK114 family)